MMMSKIFIHIIAFMIGLSGSAILWNSLVRDTRGQVTKMIKISKDALAQTESYKNTIMIMRDNAEYDNQTLKKCLIQNAKLREKK